MIDHMYYDTFAEEYVREKDPYAAPERYMLTYRGSPGIYIDHWYGRKLIGSLYMPGYAMDIAYLEEEYNTDMHDQRYADMCEQNKFRADRLVAFTIPQEKFDEYVKRFGLDEVDEDDE